ncbi:leucine--tRNA ligase [Candidatus Pacearchaeota archaeon]|nr:leucine--tRNA ligase [Candidatus Pacearchaeota archaeon]
MEEQKIDFAKIEKKWQDKWEKAKIAESIRDEKKKKFFMIFAYPGISGYQHVGHMRGFSYTDIITRFKRMSGFNVLFPTGTHASGNQAIAFAKKVQNKNEDWINYLMANGCSKEKLKELVTPEKIVEYFNKVYQEESWSKFGFLYDKNRFTCTIYPDYNKFIQWQFEKLKQANLLVQKPYFATACPVHGPLAVDASETDISKGGNAEKQEFTLLKFKYGKKYLLAATLRPETIFGQTNLWVNPEVALVEIKVGKENWIVSREAFGKLKYQKDGIELIGDFKENLLGKYATAPGIEKEIVILPSRFVDANVGTGIVTCVPSDAPYDYIALKELQENEKDLKKYGLNSKLVKAIEVIPIIETKKYGQNAGVTVVEKNSIKNQDDPKLVELTQEVYKEGFHSGILLKNCGSYAGMKVIEAKDKMKKELIDSGKADIMHDLSEEVICRCGERVIIKRIDDQWFIKYSDKDLTEKSKEHAKTMVISPKQYKDNIAGVLDWFQDRACARLGSWLGTRLPFDEKWIIEPISDSTLYPIYYLVSNYYNSGKIKLEEMTEEFFDYVFLGKGKARNKIWEEIRKDVLYWYPLDVNLGGKEHQTVHFPVFIMNHIGILPKQMWPKGIFVNYWVVGKGSKISKSKGGAQPVPEAIKQYGVDAMRLYYSHIAGPEFDVIWDEKVVFDYRRNLERIYSLIMEASEKKENKISELDIKLEIELNKEIKLVTSAIDSFDLRTAANSAFFMLSAKLRKYLQDGGANKAFIQKFLNSWVKLMSPFCPHIAEELWEKLGNKELISTAEWPKYEEIKEKKSKEDVTVKIIANTKPVIEKVSSIQKINKIYLYVMPFEINQIDKKKIEKELGYAIEIFAVNDPNKKDPENKAKKAIPGKPGVYLE